MRKLCHLISLNIIFFKLLTIGSILMGDQGAEMGKAKQYLEQLIAFTENIFPQVGSGLAPTSSSDIGVGTWQKNKKSGSRGLIKHIG